MADKIQKLIEDFRSKIMGVTLKPEHSDQIREIIQVNTGPQYDRESSINRRILEELRENNRLLHHIFRALTHNRVLGGVMSQVRTSPMQLIAPGSSPQFGVTPTPAGVVTQAANTTWTSSDPTNAPVTIDASDPTGLTATVNLGTAAVVGSDLTLTWSYKNPSDGTVVNVVGVFPVVAAAPPPPTDVTGGTMVQTA